MTVLHAVTASQAEVGTEQLIAKSQLDVVYIIMNG